ncbi:aspartate aminotransferase family protein [Bradyrhizobium sp.]|uniref:aspartate aminotransferase family protein n=1 Tax=Bradyrhizobium sp. TaxID=376 RepID=UPI0029151453|nr:aspartate aminotransferase family protein [Bradyrhizobium sp.]MDU6133836.1 aspartate aminotransferase family protein [Bradyrhizobium sp.]
MPDAISIDVPPNDLEAFWMPMTANRRFKKTPMFFSAAEGMYYATPDGRRVLDAIAGLWCVNAGHCHPRIVEAIRAQAGKLDYASSFGVGHPLAFHFANRVVEIAPPGFRHLFLAGSGSEAVDSALKFALAYHRARGEGHRQRLIGRQRAYHGVGFGGLSVSGIGWQRAQFGALLPATSHLPHTHDLARNAFSRGQPAHGVEFADALEGLLFAVDPSTVAAVIVEPMAGSTGVIPAPKGYLKRLREITQKHGILLIFDEVITGFGRLGHAFAAERYGVTPDLLTFAKGVTNGAAPMGGVVVRDTIHDAFMSGPEHMVEFTHGYTYSAHPIACAAGLATLDIYRDHKLFEHAKAIEPKWADAVMSLKGLPNVLDIRTVGLTAGIDLAPLPDAAGKRGYSAMEQAFHNTDLMLRIAGDTLALTPPLIISEDQIGEIVDKVGKVIKAVA